MYLISSPAADVILEVLGCIAKHRHIPYTYCICQPMADVPNYCFVPITYMYSNYKTTNFIRINFFKIPYIPILHPTIILLNS